MFDIKKVDAKYTNYHITGLNIKERLTDVDSEYFYIATKLQSNFHRFV